MPKGTRVHRCVSKLRKKYKYSKAIGICQKSTKQNYMTGKRIQQTKRKKKHRKKTRKKRGGTGEPNDGLIYARDFVNVAREPENGWANWQWDPNTPLPSLKVPIGSKYILYTYNNSYEPEMDIIELGSQRPYYRNPDSDDPTIAINFKIVGEHEGYTFKPEDWNKEEGEPPEIGTHQDAYDTDAEWPYAPTVYVIERWAEPPTRISDLPKKPIPKPPKSPHPAGPIEIPKSKTILPDMSKIHETKIVSAAAGGKRKTRKKRGGCACRSGTNCDCARQATIAYNRAREQETRRAEQVRRIRQEREAERIRNTLASANRLVPNRTITDLEEAQQIINNHERHQRFLHELIPRAQDVSEVPYAVPVTRRRFSFTRIPTAQPVRDGDTESAREVEVSDRSPVAIGGNSRNRRRKKRTRRRRKSLRKKKRKSRRRK